MSKRNRKQSVKWSYQGSSNLFDSSSKAEKNAKKAAVKLGYVPFVFAVLTVNN